MPSRLEDHSRNSALEDRQAMLRSTQLLAYNYNLGKRQLHILNHRDHLATCYTLLAAPKSRLFRALPTPIVFISRISLDVNKPGETATGKHFPLAPVGDGSLSEFQKLFDPPLGLWKGLNSIRYTPV